MIELMRDIAFFIVFGSFAWMMFNVVTLFGDLKSLDKKNNKCMGGEDE